MTVRLIVGDALQECRRLPNESVDVVLTDPPFSSGATREAGKVRKDKMTRSEDPNRRWFGSDQMTTRGITCLIRDLSVEWFRVLKPGGHVLCFVDWRMLPDFSDAIESADLRKCGIVVWNKNSFGMGRVFRKQHEMVLHFSRGTPAVFDRGTPDVISACRVQRKRSIHPTEKPVELLARLIGATSPKGGVVLDPFAGSGSTAVAAASFGADAVLIERDRRYADAIASRLNLAEQMVTDRLPTEALDEEV